MAGWLRRLAVKLLAHLRCGSGSNPMIGSCQLLTEGCWFTPRNKLFLQLWKLKSIYNQIRLKSGVNTNSSLLTSLKIEVYRIESRLRRMVFVRVSTSKTLYPSLVRRVGTLNGGTVYQSCSLGMYKNQRNYIEEEFLIHSFFLFLLRIPCIDTNTGCITSIP